MRTNGLAVIRDCFRETRPLEIQRYCGPFALGFIGTIFDGRIYEGTTILLSDATEHRLSHKLEGIAEDAVVNVGFLSAASDIVEPLLEWIATFRLSPERPLYRAVDLRNGAITYSESLA